MDESEELESGEMLCAACGEIIVCADVYCVECGVKNDNFDEAEFQEIYKMNSVDAHAHYCAGDYHEDFLQDMIACGDEIGFCNICGEALHDTQNGEVGSCD